MIIEWMPAVETPATELVGQTLWFDVRVSDGAATARQNIPVTVHPANSAPVVAAIADRTVTAGASLALAVSASDPNGDPLSFQLDPDSLARGMTISSTGQVAWNPGAEHLAASPYTVSLSVSDGRADAVTRTFQVTVLADTTPPAVGLDAWRRGDWLQSGSGIPWYPPLEQAAVGEVIMILVHALDNVAVADRTLALHSVTFAGQTTVLDRALPMDGAGWARLTLTPELVGTVEFHATATDTAGLAASAAPLSILVFDPADVDPPVVSLIAPAGGQKITQPADMLGSVHDDQPGVTWTLDWLAGDRSGRIAAGSGPVDRAVLGSFDPTLLRNGSYQLVLSAIDSGGNLSQDQVTVEVEGELKLGNFTLSFVDLELQLVGLPITVTRTYDTLEADVDGDFGYGWRLDLSNTAVEVIQPGNTWGVPEPFDDNDRIVFTLPDGSRHGFTFYGRPVNQGLFFADPQAWPAFQPDPGTTSTLSMSSMAPALYRVAGGYADPARGNQMYNPATGAYGQYVLRLRNGTELIIDPRDGQLQQATDPLGNSLYFSDTRIWHSSGRGVRFERQNGRITALIDPAGAVITYDYDSRGNLAAVTDRTGATTTFAYLDDPQHYLHEIRDPLGRPAARTEYDAQGRIKRLTDAGGQTIEYQWNADSKIQRITDQLGHVSTIETDARGNVVREDDPEGGITLRSYDAQNNLLSETIVVGLHDSPQNGESNDLVTTYTYDSDGNRLTETDARGNVTHSTYNQYGQVTSVTGPATRSSNQYAANGLLRSIRDANNRQTRFDYDGRGNMTAVKDHDGNILVTSTYNQYGEVTATTSAAGRSTHFDYDTNGNQIATWYFAVREAFQPDLLQILDVTHYDETNRVTGARRLVLPDEHHVTANLTAVDFTAPLYAEYTLWATGTVYNAAGQAVRTIDQQGNASETTHDLRGQPIQSRTETQAGGGSPDPAQAAFLLSRTFYDPKGRAVVTADSFVEDPDVTAANAAAFDPQTGTYHTFTFDNTTATTASFSVYDGAGHVVQSYRLKDITIAVVTTTAGTATVQQAELRLGANTFVPPTEAAPDEQLHETYFRELTEFFQTHGAIVSNSQTLYDNAGRVTSSFDQYGAETRTAYNRFGEVVETRRQSRDAAGQPVWLVSRTVYDQLGRALVATDQYLEGTSDLVYATRTLYDDQGRATGSIRLQDVQIDLVDGDTLLVGAGTQLWQTGTQYNPRGQVARSIAADGQTTDQQYDSLGRQTATIGHPVPAESVGLALHAGYLVRHRTETVYDSQGRVAAQRANIVQVEDAAGNVIAIDDSAAQTTSYGYDPFGNRTTTTFTDGSYILVRYDDFGRQTAEMQQIEGLYLVDWSGPANSFIVTGWDADGDGQSDATQPPDTLDLDTLIPTKVFEYDTQSRLSAVVLPAVEHPDPTIGLVHPRYEYTHDAQGNLVGIRDNVYQVSSAIYYAHGGTANDFSEQYDTRLTWFTFDANGRQLTRTLPLGVRDEFGTTLPDQLPFPETDAARLPFTEYFAYNDLGQQTLHVSFEGIVTAFVYDDSPGSGGRLLEKQFFTDLDAYHAAPTEPEELWTFSHDAFGRQTHVAADLRDAGSGLLEPARTEANTYNPLGQLITVATTEGTIHYEYDHLGRHTRTYTGDRDTTGVPAASDGIAINDTRYTYNALGRMDSVTVVERFDQPLAAPETTDYIYTLMGNLAQVRLTNGVIADYQYDDLNRLELLRHFKDQPGGEPGRYEENVDILLAEYDYDLLPDGRRSGVTEKIWLDADENGIFDPSELAETCIDWAYDPVGRLVRESYDTHDNSLDYVTDYIFDLVGNRLLKLTDTDPDWVALGEGLPTSPDQSVTYSYDINDRLLVETAATWDGGTPAWITDRTTLYQYGSNADPSEGIGGDHTMQTRKTVWQGTDTDPASGTRLADSTFGYNLQNRLSGALINPDGDGPQPPVESRYAYNTSGIRVAKVEGTDKVLYLVDGNNPTGYAQVLEEMAWEREAWQIARAFTLGLNVISQAEATGEIDHLLYDGHGSTRALLDTAGLIIPGQIYAYDAYGNAHGFDPAVALTTLLYAGEQFDQRLQMQYLRARYYDAATGRFNRLDPFFGNIQDPLSLHKYLYVHGDPISGADPSGEFLIGFGSLLVTTAVNSKKLQGDGVKISVGQYLTEALGASAAAGTVAGAIYAGLSLDFSRGAIYGFKLGLGLYVAWRKGGGAFNAAIKLGLYNAFSKIVEIGTDFLAHVGAHVGQDFDRMLDGPLPGIKETFDRLFTAFADGVFAQAMDIGGVQTDFICDVADAGITRTISDFFQGKVNSLRDLGESLATGSMDMFVLKLAVALNDAADGGPAGKLAVTAGLRFIWSGLKKMALG